MNEPKNGSYDIGYGKPPPGGQFKPGQSGNPSGKKKGKGLAHYLADVGEQEKTFMQGGEQVTMLANQALAQSIFTDAIKGKHAAAKIVLDAHKSVAGDLPLADMVLAGPEELEVARTHANWLKLIEDCEKEAANADAAE